jgi:hypothetical protein
MATRDHLVHRREVHLRVHAHRRVPGAGGESRRSLVDEAITPRDGDGAREEIARDELVDIRVEVRLQRRVVEHTTLPETVGPLGEGTAGVEDQVRRLGVESSVLAPPRLRGVRVEDGRDLVHARALDLAQPADALLGAESE